MAVGENAAGGRYQGKDCCSQEKQNGARIGRRLMLLEQLKVEARGCEPLDSIFRCRMWLRAHQTGGVPPVPPRGDLLGNVCHLLVSDQELGPSDAIRVS